jgi:hypothetical protein
VQAPPLLFLLACQQTADGLEVIVGQGLLGRRALGGVVSAWVVRVLWKGRGKEEGQAWAKRGRGRVDQSIDCWSVGSTNPSIQATSQCSAQKTAPHRTAPHLRSLDKRSSASREQRAAFPSWT